MIPLPSAIDNHQFLNAVDISNLNMGLVHEESEPIESLTNKIKNIIEKKLYVRWSESQNNLDHFQAANNVKVQS